MDDQVEKGAGGGGKEETREKETRRRPTKAGGWGGDETVTVPSFEGSGATTTDQQVAGEGGK